MDRLLVAFAAAIVVVLASRPAHACKCSSPSLASSAANANVVFVGTIAKVHEDKQCHPQHADWCTSSFKYEIAVEGVFKGSVGKRVTIDAGHGRGNCSMGSLGKHAVGKQWLVLSSSTQAPYFIKLCGNTQPATAEKLAALAKQLGAPKLP
jgi:hypothetical protein